MLDSPDNGIELIAVRRSVEGMALWPHPSFAATTCGTWRKYNMSWSLPPHGKVPVLHETLSLSLSLSLTLTLTPLSLSLSLSLSLTPNP